MRIEIDGEQILNEHDKIFSLLLSIPKNRILTYREDIENGCLIGKPRFKEKFFNWPSDLLVKFHDHLQELWNFFSRYSYWFDKSIKEMLAFDERIMSGKSVKYLLERDVWETAEVFGAYLIENKKDNTIISYYRFQSKIKSFKFPALSYEERKQFVINDAIDQIQLQFSYMWERLRTEIEVCREEKYHKYPPIKLKNNYLNEQIKIIQEFSSDCPEASLLLLGRLSELWLLNALKYKRTRHRKLVDEASKRSILRQADARF